MNFRQLDLNLLRVLGAVYRSGSVTEAGRQLALSQPATSNALARLRRYFDDAAVRALAGWACTRRGWRAASPLGDGLAARAGSRAAERRVLRPRHRSRALAAVAVGPGRAAVPAAAGAPLRREAPASTAVQRVGPGDHLPAALEAMEVDLAIGILNPQHRGVASESLFHEHFVA
jgi:DNA-binding transcriptional LysR family regulator